MATNTQPLSVLFLTYSAVSDAPGKTAFLGVLKRCLRLIAGMGNHHVIPHLLNFGSLPAEDPLIRQVVPQLHNHIIREEDGEEAYHQLFAAIKPDVVVLGEGPGSGNMLALSRTALQHGIPQVCIENYYGPGQPQHYKKENPWIDRWLLLGLPFDNAYGRITPNAELVPPLLPASNGFANQNIVDVTILGYDSTVAQLGVQLLHKLPPQTSARLVYSQSLKKYLYNFREQTRTLNIELAELPSEQQLQCYLATSRLVVCKSGFQQMVECLAAGTPALAYDAPGGVPEILLADPMRPYVRYFPRKESAWHKLLLQSALWLQAKPSMPWHSAVQQFSNPVSYAADKLYGLLCEVAA